MGDGKLLMLLVATGDWVLSESSVLILHVGVSVTLLELGSVTSAMAALSSLSTSSPFSLLLFSSLHHKQGTDKKWSPSLTPSRCGRRSSTADTQVKYAVEESQLFLTAGLKLCKSVLLTPSPLLVETASLEDKVQQQYT